jgi:hypothetical protein
MVTVMPKTVLTTHIVRLGIRGRFAALSFAVTLVPVTLSIAATIILIAFIFGVIGTLLSSRRVYQTPNVVRVPPSSLSFDIRPCLLNSARGAVTFMTLKIKSDRHKCANSDIRIVKPEPSMEPRGDEEQEEEYQRR